MSDPYQSPTETDDKPTGVVSWVIEPLAADPIASGALLLRLAIGVETAVDSLGVQS